MLNYIIKMKTQRQFLPSTKECLRVECDPLTQGCPQGQGQGRGHADPHEGWIWLRLGKIYLLTFMTRPSPQFDYV